MPSGGRVGLAASGLAVEDEVLCVVEELEAGELVGVVAVGHLDVRVVVAVQAFDDGELGAAQQALAFALFAVLDLAGGHGVDGVDLAGRGPCE